MIYHYTSIKSLALILKSKKIRFTRLDCLDDTSETEGLLNSMKTQIFVSCWTEDSNENISLWSLYTQMSGVRLALPKNPFNNYQIQAGDQGGWGYYINVVTPLPLDNIRTDEYLISNPFWLDDGFYKKITYTDLYAESRMNIYNQTDQGVDLKAVQNLCMYKDKIWEFQKESRFYLIAIPLPPLRNFKDKKTQMLNINGLMENSIKHIDVELNQSVLDNLIVRMSPKTSDADKIIVDALLQKYTKAGKLELSNLKIR